MALRILKLGEPKLRRISEPVRRITARERRLVEDMIPTMRAASGVGLAAPQVGVNIRLVVMELPKGHESDDPDDWDWNETELHALFNPVLLDVEDFREIEEGCLSLPGFQAALRRGRAVRARGATLDGKTVNIEARGLFAQALQHEVEHLDGKLIHDSLGSLLDLRQVKPPWIKDGNRRRRSAG